MAGSAFRAVTIEPFVDGVAPVLSSPTGTATGSTTASGTVTTDENNGTLYFLASANATETAATVVSTGSSQAVSASGVQNVTFSSLTAETGYYAHYVHDDDASNRSNRVSSAQFTTDAEPAGGSAYRAVTIMPASDTISSVSGSKAGATITVNTGGIRNLTVNAPTLTYGGLACTSISVVDADTFTCVMPSAGLEIGSTNNFVLTVFGVQSPAVPAVYGPLLDEYETLLDFADIVPDSPLKDPANIEPFGDIVAGDQIDYDARTSATTNAPLGYLVDVLPDGSFVFTGYDMRLETEAFTVDYYLIDSADYSRSPSVGQLIFTPFPPAGDITIGAVLTTATTATIPFTFSGTNLTGYQYRIGSGSWTGFSNSPLQLTGLTAATDYTVQIRAANGIAVGTAASTTFTTSSASDTTPDAYTFTDQTGVQISTSVTSNSIAVTGVTAGIDVPISITGGEYSYSLDNGATWDPWASTSGNVRLNYLVRVRRTSSASYSAAVTAVLTIGGVSDTFTLTTRADDVAPVITLTGGNVTLTGGDAWVDPGYSATDNADGNVTADVVVSGTVNTATPGAYTVTYTVTDAAGNTATVSRTVTVVALATGLQVDSAPAEINRYGTFNLVLSGAVEAPTVLNTVVRVNGSTGPQLTTTGVTGSGPWTVAVTARFEVPIQFSSTGYPLHIAVGAESVQTEAIPMLPGSLPFIDLLTVATGPGTIHDVFPQWVLGVADQIIYQAATRIAGVPVAIDSAGVPRLLGPLLVNDSIIYRVIKADGTVSTVPPNLEFTFQADPVTEPPVFPSHRNIVWDGTNTPALVLGDTFKHRITLRSSGEPFNVSAATDISACIVSVDHQTKLNTAVSLTASTEWAFGMVTITMDTDSTAEIATLITTEQFAWAEIQVTLAGEKYTWFGAVRLVPGHIA